MNSNKVKRVIKILTRNIAAIALAILALVVLAKATLALGINDDYITVGLVVLIIAYFTARDYTADKWRHVHIDLTMRDVLKTDDGEIYEVSVMARRIHLLSGRGEIND